MFTETDIKEDVHPMVLHVLSIEHKKLGSLRMAQAAVAQKIGGSARWLRRIIGRCPSAVLHSHQAMNIARLYVERKGDRARLKDLWRKVLGKCRARVTNSLREKTSDAELAA